MPQPVEVNLKIVDGHIGGITYSLAGPESVVVAIVKFIRSLTRFVNNAHYIREDTINTNYT